MSLTFSHFSRYLTSFTNKINILNNIILSVKSKNIIQMLWKSTKKNLYRNSLRIAIQSFENNDHSYLNSLNPDEVYNAYIEFSNKFNISICKKNKIIHNIEQYGIYDYIEILINIPYIPIKIKNELTDFIDGYSSLCVYCNCNMKLQQSNRCYDNSQIYCDFTREIIPPDSNTLHCLGGKNTHHCNGFDISLENSSVYFNDLMDKRLEKRIYNVFETNNYTIDEIHLRFIYSVICSNMIQSTIIYYNSIYRDLSYLRLHPNIYSNRELYLYNTDHLMQSHLNQMKRILIAVNKNWKLECDKLIIDTEKYIHCILNDFKKTLSLDANIYFTQIEKDTSIINHRIQLSDLITTIKNKIEFIRNYNTILEHLENISVSSNITTLYNSVDIQVYRIYELIEILEKSTPIEQKLPITIVSSIDSNSNCSICLDTLHNEELLLMQLFNQSGIDPTSSELYANKLNESDITLSQLINYYHHNNHQFISILNSIDIINYHLENLKLYLQNDYNQLDIIPTVIFKINYCNHLFHKECLNKWLQITNNCPICRTDTHITNSSHTSSPLILNI